MTKNQERNRSPIDKLVETPAFGVSFQFYYMADADEWSDDTTLVVVRVRARESRA